MNVISTTLVTLFFAMSPLSTFAMDFMSQDAAEDPSIHVGDKGTYYVGKTKGRNLWNTMELVTADSLPAWRKFADVQFEIGKSSRVSKAILPRGAPLAEGSRHFQLVLDQLSITKNELWIGYVVAVPYLTNDSSKLSYYDRTFLDKFIEQKNSASGKNDFAKALKRFVTVTSSPKAKIISSMGISTAVESVHAPEKDTAMDLLSFIAKVMRMKNPDRRFMIHAPTPFMAMTLIKHVKPVYFGTRETLDSYNYLKKLSFEEYKEYLLRNNDPTAKDVEDSAKLQLQVYMGKLKAGKTKQEVSALFQKDGFAKGFLEEDSTGFSISSQKVKEAIERALKDQYEGSAEGHWEYPAYKGHVDDMESFIAKHPPIISVDNKKRVEASMVIYDPQEQLKPWLTIEKGDPDYDWIFTEPFDATGFTHYIAVDLKALAESRQLDSLSSWKKRD